MRSPGTPYLPQGDAGLDAKLLQRTKAGDLLADQARQKAQLCCANRVMPKYNRLYIGLTYAIIYASCL